MLKNLLMIGALSALTASAFADDAARAQAEKVIALTGSSSKLVSHPLPENDPMQRRPDITRAKTMLDWQPTIPLEDGLMKTIAYFDGLLSRRLENYA